MPKNSFNFATNIATSRDQVRTCKEKLFFDYFNPNGAYAAYITVRDRAYKFADKGLVAYGLLMAYDGEYSRKNLARLANRKSSCSKFESVYYGDQLRELTAKLTSKLDEAKGK